MTGVSIFLLGTVALTNVGFLLYLMRDNNQKASPPQAKPPEQPQPTEAENSERAPDTAGYRWQEQIPHRGI